MPPKLKSVAFKNGQLKKTGTTVVHLEPDGDDFQTGYCVKVVTTDDSTQYWGGKVQSVGSDRKALARLKYQVTPCADNPDDAAAAADPGAAKGGPPKGSPPGTTDVSVTITNPTTNETSPVLPKAVTVLP